MKTETAAADLGRSVADLAEWSAAQPATLTHEPSIIRYSDKIQNSKCGRAVEHECTVGLRMSKFVNVRVEANRNW